MPGDTSRHSFIPISHHERPKRGCFCVGKKVYQWHPRFRKWIQGLCGRCSGDGIVEEIEVWVNVASVEIKIKMVFIRVPPEISLHTWVRDRPNRSQEWSYVTLKSIWGFSLRQPAKKYGSIGGWYAHRESPKTRTPKVSQMTNQMGVWDKLREICRRETFYVTKASTNSGRCSGEGYSSKKGNWTPGDASCFSGRCPYVMAFDKNARIGRFSMTPIFRGTPSFSTLSSFLPNTSLLHVNELPSSTLTVYLYDLSILVQSDSLMHKTYLLGHNRGIDDPKEYIPIIAI